MEFIAIDIETANPDRSSICQVGIARFKDGLLVEEWQSYIDPEVDFNDRFTNTIHGINKEIVKNSPKFNEVINDINSLLDNKIVVSHGPFDKNSISKAVDLHDVRLPNCTWLDTLQVARRAWPELKHHGLSDICKKINYEFKHHDALEDAKAAGQVLLAAITKTGIPVDKWL